MKTLLGVAVASVMGAGFLAAATPSGTGTNAPSANQNYSYHTSTDTSPTNVNSQLMKSIPPNQGKAVPTTKFAPRPTGAAYDVYKDGPIVLAPWASKDHGYGEQNLAAPVPNSHGPNSLENPGKEADFGGLKLFGFDF